MRCSHNTGPVAADLEATRQDVTDALAQISQVTTRIGEKVTGTVGRRLTDVESAVLAAMTQAGEWARGEAAGLGSRLEALRNDVSRLAAR